MKLLEKISQHRRDFKGKYECENCGAIKTDSGLDSYDDEFFSQKRYTRNEMLTM